MIITPPIRVLFIVVILCGAVSAQQKSGMTPVDLRTEYLTNPIGLGATSPRFYWLFDSNARGQKQTAYQIVIASSSAALGSNKGDLWDSGKVTGSQNIHVTYGGKALSSMQKAYWKVRVWDKDGRESSWSVPASFEMGLLKPTDWKAQWISISAIRDEDRMPFVKSKWIYVQGNMPAASGQKLQVWREVNIPVGRTVTRAEMHYAVDFRDGERGTNLFINGKLDPSLWRSARQLGSPSIFQLRDYLKPGRNSVALEAAYGPGRGFIAMIHIELDNGSSIDVPTDASWRARVASSRTPWSESDLNESGWGQAREVGSFGEAIGGFALYKDIDRLVPPPYLRKEFNVARTVRSARVYVTATGVYELWLNGKRVGNDYFNPGWTDYGKRIQYQAYDVTSMLRQGRNAIGGIVGDGWYSGHNGLFNVNPNYYGFDKSLLCQLAIEYSDGSVQVIASDGSWRGRTGPIRYSDMFMGETYDARQELPGWGDGGYDDSRWQPAIITRPHVGPLVAQADPPVRETRQLVVKKMTQPRSGVYVFDLGQNMVGWARVTARGKSGDRIKVRFAEMLNADGTVFVDNLRTAISTDYFYLKGKPGPEVFEPHFTFHGFRYVELTGYPGIPTPADVRGIVLHSDLPMTGVFETSNAMINQLQSNIQWGQRGNFLSVPTDCPQRDERDGWTGDIQAFSRTATFNMDSAAFLGKWLIDLEDGQDAQGSLPDIAPTSRTFPRGKFGWGDAGVMVPWNLYLAYNDLRMIESRYGMMKGWVEYLRRNGKGELSRNAAGEYVYTGKGHLAPTDSYGDWVSPKPEAPKDVLSTEFYARVVWQFAKMAEAVGRREDARQYMDLFEQIKVAFNNAYVGKDGRITSRDKAGNVTGDTQTLYVCALRFGLVDGEMRKAAEKHLFESFERSNWHLGTGFLGAVNLMPILTELGRNDVAYRLLNNDTMPSWGYTIKNGATTIWERWDGYEADKGPSNMGNMNSFNHYAFGAVGEWMYANIGGIETDPMQPGFRHILIRPQPGGGLTWANTEYKSISGRIATRWKLEKGVFSLDVKVPANTTATIHVPASSAESVRESGRAASGSSGLRFVSMKDGAAVFEAESGSYHFVSSK